MIYAPFSSSIPEYRNYTFFFSDATATTEIYTLSLHDALPICTNPVPSVSSLAPSNVLAGAAGFSLTVSGTNFVRSEEHTSKLQSHHDLVCRLLLEKKKTAYDPKQHQLDKTSPVALNSGSELAP